MWWSKKHARVTEGARTLAAPMIMSLEPRMLFDGAVAATVADTAAQADSHPAADAAKAPAADHPVASKDTHGQADAAPAASPVAVPGQSVVFVDSRVKDADSLLQGIAPGTQVVKLDAGKDGLQQIADYLDQHQGVSSVQIIAHGNAGDLWLGNSYLSADNVAQRSAVLAEIGKDMNVGGDILIYGCYTAEGDRGLSFVDSLAQLTGRDVAASNNRTGVGGDWNLEIATGNIESANVLSAKSMSEYQWGLATWTATNNLNTGVGSLRAALASAQNGDIVTFSSGMTVQLTSELLINKNITVDGDLNNDGVADVTLDGQYKTRVVEIASGSTVTLDGLVITRGLVSGNGGNGGYGAAGAMGGGIFNAGVLTLSNVSVTSNAAAGGGGGGGVTGAFYGGGGGGQGSNASNGGIAGRGVGAIWNQGGTVLITAANFAAISGNGAGSGAGGTAQGGGSTGASPTAFAAIFNNGGTLNTAYVEPPTATIVVSDTALKIGETSLVTITFSRAVTGFTNADLTIANGTLSAVSSADGGITWTATFTPTNGITDTTNLIVLDNTGVTAVSDGAAGVGTTSSNNYAIDTQRPTATIVLADSALKVGETSQVTITFSEAVSGFTNADLTIPNGTLSAVSSADGGITWTATFTPTANITDTTNLITLDNTGVVDLSGNAGSGTTDSANFTIDTQRPTATIVVTDTNLAAGETSLVTITFSEAVTGFTTADLTVANGTLSGLSSSDGGITWTATLTPNANITDSTNLVTLDNTGIADLAGNAGSGTTNSNNYAIDTARPTATIVVADNALKIGETSLVTITFSEAVTGFTNADLTIANGTLSAVSSSDGGITWTATFTPTANITDATNVITLDNTGVTDAAGNTGSGTTDSNNYAVDTQRPTATIVVANPTLAVGQTSLVTITFSEAVTGFTNADLTIANGTLSAVSSSDGGITWTATFTPTANVTDATNLITLDNTGVADTSGNAGSGTTDSNNYAIDTQRPTATIVMADSNLAAGETSLVTITFSEAVTGFTNADLTVPNGTLSAVSSSDGGITWTATFTPSVGVNDATNVITLANTGIADLAGNAGSGTTNSGNFTINTQVPTATIVVANSSLGVGGTSLVTITFSEAVTGFTNADLTVANGTLSAVSSADGGVTWTATFTPTANVTDTSNLITLDNTGVQNSVGNAGSGTTDSNNYAIDTQRPTATIVVADTALGVGQTTTVTITFSEAVTGFSLADLTAENGTLSGLTTSDNITWTATFTPAAGITDTTNLITLDNTGVADVAGNAGSGTTDSNNYAVDSQRPTATIVMADTDLRPGETTTVTITFSEAVTGFDNSDLSIPNGTLSSVTSSDGGITWTATFTPALGVTDNTNLIVLNNAGYTDVAGNAGLGTTSSANFTVNTLVPTATIVVADTALKAGETSLVTITFNEAVSGFDNSDLIVANGTLSNVSSSDGGITWTATFTPTANVTDTTNLITLNNAGVTNASGNSGVGTTDSNNFAIDTALPTATITVADNRLGIGETTTVTITFSEAVSGFDLSDISVANGVLSNLSSSDGGVTWTATLTPTAGVNDATNLIVLDTAGVQDAAGNLGASIAISNNYILDATRPTVNIVVANPHLGIGQTTTVTFTFSEAVSNFDLSDLSVTNGDLSNLSSSDGGKTWTATFTPTANVTDPSNFIALDTSNVTDLAGNAGSTVAVSNNYALDAERPTATVVVANPNLGIGQTTQVTITFNEAVSGFDLADISVANGTLSGLSSNDGGKTWTATLTPNANVNSASNAISVNAAGVSDLSGNSGSGISQSGNYVINTVPPTPPTSPTVVVTPDPEFRSSDPVTVAPPPYVPLQPIVFTPPTGNLGSPLTFSPLFEQRVIGDGIRPLGDIFINRGALSPSFIAQVFGDSTYGDGTGHGFLGFGGGDGGVFGSSTFAGLFNQASDAERESVNAFDSHPIKGGDISQGLRGVFGAPTLGQQLQQFQDSEQHRVDSLAAALKQIGVSETPSA
ncbi:Ig-like domain-containing protein [Pseudomonas sp. R29(2017)]|uniref:Ig-like domain-containing protein n=1 Tax=Pseudomonas sp. R29(2017) TaxID=1981692 RepID=UPI000A1F0E3B|nr:Ig-like domain-containing protein [Pseudomonas sp. R29(2017)]